MKCDFHIHSIFSDGIFPPETLIEMAHERGLDCVSITDHDTFAGVERARKRASELNIKCLVGAELSAVYNGMDVHVLAYNVDLSHPDLPKAVQYIDEMRVKRNEAMVARLAEHGVVINLADLDKEGTVGRPVIAREMVRLGYCETVPEAFERYIGTGKCCFVQVKRLTPGEAVRFALRFGGIPVLAHPKQLHFDEEHFEAFLKPLVGMGLSGIEADYFAHNTAERNFYNKMAKKYKLIVTGGSDFHDYVHGVEIGTARGIEIGANRTKLETAKALIGLLPIEVIAEKIGLPLETVSGLE